MLGQPIADITQRIRVTRQIDAVAQRRGRFGARGDDGKVEDRERNHGAKLVRRIGPTKAFAAQIRRAPAGRTKTDSSASMGQNMIVSLPDHLPTSELDVSVTGFFDKLQKMNMFSTFNLRMAVNISAQ